MDNIFKNRDNYFNFVVTASLADIKNADLQLRELLQDCQKFNLLCQNEVEFFYENKFHVKPEEEFFNDIQQRLLLHRVEELKIKNSKIKKGGFISVANGSRIQGTAHIGGMQPDYIIDTKSAEIQYMLKEISFLKSDQYSVWEKIDTFGQILREKYIARTEYDDSSYVKLLSSYKDMNLEIPLSEYLKINKGVCRESALLTVIGLNSIGVESYYYYAKVGCKINEDLKQEDHAVVLVNINNNFWVIDNYFRAFNKKPLEQLQSLDGIETYLGLMYDSVIEEKKGQAYIITSRLYPEAKHNSNHIS